jgi:class 3 adenylate cyclase/tetratricopeptide (TPR) repeat protein
VTSRGAPSDPSRTCAACGAAVSADARFCPNCGSPVGTATSAEERKVATIVFADVTGSTDLGEQLDPERLRSLLSEFFGAMSGAIDSWGGTVEKYIGDAILAIFGVPAAREDDPIRALHAATEMLSRLDGLNNEFERRHGVRLAMRIGVNTGEVLVPEGGRGGGQFLVSGDPVNVAARLEQSAEPGTVMVGERTFLAAKGAFEFGDPVHLEVKGKREPVLARRLGQPTVAEPSMRFQAPMVGRERELGTLLGLLDEAIESELPRLVVVSAPAGMGKSRLLREFVTAAAERRPDLTVLRGRCLAAGHGITFWALAEILRSACGISLDEPGEAVVAKLRETVDSLLAPLDLRPADREITFFALATTAGLGVAGNPLEMLEPEGVAEEMARAWPRLLSGLAARSPTAIVIEDIHWADEQLVGMLETIVARSRGRVVLLATTRPEFLEAHPGFASGEDLTVIALRPLTDAQTERLVAELLGESGPLQALLAEVRQKAEGNPFFLEELLQRLIDEGAIVRDSGRWQVTEHAHQVRLPDTVHGLLAARIDGLPAAEKALLQQAAVVGRIFWPGSLGPSSVATGAELLRSLERRGLIAARPTSTIEGETEYIFRHMLIRDVAYASVPRARRARAHAETGRWIEELAGDRIEEFGEVLAYHYAAAAAGDDADLAWADEPGERERLRQRAIEILLRAGGAARRRFAMEKAIDMHTQALHLSADALERRRAQEALGDDHEALFHMDEAVDAYLAAIDAAREAGGNAEMIGTIVAKLGLTMLRWGAFRRDPPHEKIQTLIAESLSTDVSDHTRAELLIGSGILGGKRSRSSSRTPWSGMERADVPQYLEQVRAGLAIAERLDDPVLLFRAHGVLQLLYWHLGDIPNYRQFAERQVALLDRLPSRRDRVDALVDIAATRADAGRYREALDAANQAFDLAAELSPHERMHASFHVMWVADALGEWDRVIEILPWHLEAAAAEADVSCPNVRGGPPLGGSVLVWRGELEQAMSRVPVDERATTRDSYFDRSLAARYASLVGRDDLATAIIDGMTSDPERINYTDGLEVFIETLERLGRHAEITHYLEAARRMADMSVLLAPVADRAEASLALEEGDRARARRLLEGAVRRFDELSVPFEAARTRELLAQAVDESERQPILRTALQTYKRLGARPFVERVEAALAGGVAANP